MDAGSIERLLLRQSEDASPRQVRELEALIARQGTISGRGVRQRRLPWGTITSFSSTGGEGGTSPIFAPTVTRAGDGFSVTWERGTIGGMEPKIGSVPISGKREAGGKAGKPPSFTVPAAAFKDGEAKVYFRGTLNANWALTVLEPFASAEVPASKPWTFYKLALLVFSDATYWRALYSNQGYLAISRNSTSGASTPLFWSKM